MPVSPVCLAAINAGPFISTTNGINVAANDTISVKLADTTGVTTWFLEVFGIDELSSAPTLTGVNPITHQVATPSTVVTFTFPNATGRAVILRSTVQGTGGPNATTFEFYTLTAHNRRVGAFGETLEGNTVSGWLAIFNPLIRSGASVLYYNDSLLGPPTGANTIQGAIDYLKGATPSLNGDVTGPLTANSVIKINGATVPVAGALTPGNVLQVSGASALAYGPVNLAGGANYVTGVLPAGNQAAQNLAGDLSGTTSSATVAGISGGSPFPITPGTLRWVAAATIVLTQLQAVAGAGHTMSLIGQAAAVGSNAAGADVVIAGGPKDGSGTDGNVSLKTGSTEAARAVGAQLNVTTLGVGGFTNPQPTVTSGTGAPASTPANGSLYLRTDGPDGSTGVYVREGGAWWPLASGTAGAAGGDLSGTYPNPTVAKINGATVPAAGALTTGNVLQVSGVSALTYGPVNLAGGANYVTGVLPSGNQAAQTLTGDVTGTTSANTLVAMTGTAGVVSSAAAIKWTDGANNAPNTGALRFPTAGSGLGNRYVMIETHTVPGQGPGAGNINVLSTIEQALNNTSLQIGDNVHNYTTVVGQFVGIASAVQTGVNGPVPNSAFPYVSAQPTLVAINTTAAGHIELTAAATEFLRFSPGGGTSIAASGTVRAAKDFALKTRNSINSGDSNLLSLDSADNITIGDVTQTGSLILNGPSAMYTQGASFNICDAAGNYHVRFFATGDTTVATTGTMRVAKDFSLYGRNVGGTADSLIAKIDPVLGGKRFGDNNDITFIDTSSLMYMGYNSSPFTWYLYNCGVIAVFSSGHGQSLLYPFGSWDYAEDINPLFRQLQRTGDNATHKTVYQAQDASATATAGRREGGSLGLYFGANTVGYTTTTGGVELGVNGGTFAATGHMRVAKDFSLKGRNSANTNDLPLLVLNGSDQIQIGDTALVSDIFAQASGTITLRSSGASYINLLSDNGVIYYDASVHHIRSGAGAEFATFTASTEELRIGASGHVQPRLLPWPSAPTVYGSLYLLPSATATAGGNYTLIGDGTHTYLNSPGAAGHIYALHNNGTVSLDLSFSLGSLNVPLNLNGASGTFPAFGNLRSKDSENILAGNYSASDYGLISWDAGGLILGAKKDFTSPVSVVTLNAVNAVNIACFSGNTHWYILNTGVMQAYKTDIDQVIEKRGQVADVVTHDLLIRGQAPFGSATGANRNPGNVAIDIPAKVGSPGHNGGFDIRYNGTNIIKMGEYADSSSTYGAIWFGSAAIAPSTTNWSFLGEGSNSYLNAANTIFFGSAANYRMQMTTSVLNMGFSYSTPSYIFDFSATAVMHFGIDATSAKIKYDDKTTDVAPIDLLIEAQGPFASATGANRKPGHTVVNIPAHVGSPGHYGGFDINYNGTRIARIGEGNDSTTTGLYIYGGPAAVSPSTTNFNFYGDGGTTAINGFSHVFVELAGTAMVQFTNSTSPSVMRIGTTNYSLPAFIFDMSATAIMHFGVDATSAQILYDKMTSDAATHTLEISGQDAFTGSTGANRNGGYLWLRPGLHDGAGLDGAIQMGQSNFATIGTATGVSILLPYDSEIRFRNSANNGDVGGIYSTGNNLYLGSYSSGASFPLQVNAIAQSAINLTSGGSIMTWNGNDLQLDQGLDHGFYINDRASDAATKTFTIHGQSPFGSATGTNRRGGAIVVRGGLGIGGQIDGQVTIGSSNALTALTGSITFTTRTITGNLTVDTTTTDLLIYADTNSVGALTITLPPPVNGRVIMIQDPKGSWATNNVTIAPNGGEKIQGTAGNYLLTTDWGWAILTSNGTDWFVMR